MSEHWVKQRAECEVKFVYCTLIDIVRRDVNAFNTLSGIYRRECRTFRIREDI